MPDEPSEPFRFFAYPAFVFFMLTRTTASLAGGFLDVAIGWQIYALTSQPLDLGLIGLAEFLPAFVLALPAGWATDRYRRRTIIRVANAVKLLAALCLVTLSAADGMSRTALFVMAAVTGTARAFEWPAASALLPGLVPRSHLSQAVAWNASGFQTTTLLGPPIAGFLYILGATTTYGACALLWAAALVFAFMLPPGVKAVREPVTFATVFAGIGFIFREPVVLGAISLDLFGVLFGGATALLPIFARDILHAGPVALGLLRSAPGAGALLIALILSRRPIRRRNGLALFIAMGGFGLATCLFALSTNILLSMGLLAVIGATDMVNVAIRSTLVQLRTPDAMRGRVAAVNGTFIQTSNQLGEFESGVTAQWFGTVPSVVIGGLGTLAVVVIWAATFTRLRRVDRLEE